MHRRAVFFPAVAVAIALVVSAGLLSAQAKPLKPGYVLEWKTEIKSGIRAYPETVYTFFEVQPNQTRKVLWTAKESDRPLRHWISSVGNVYVLNDPMPGPGQGSRIWLRNKVGEHQGTFGTHRLVKQRPVKDPREFRIGAPFEVDKVVLRELRSGQAEELLLPVKDWGTGRLIVMWPNPKEKPQAYAYWLPNAKTPDPILEDVLENPEYKVPTHELPFGSDFGFAVWTAEGVDSTTKPRYWVQTGEFWNHSDAGMSRSQLAEIKSEENAASRPTRLMRLPQWKVAWIETITSKKPGLAQLRVINRQATAKVDLIKLGGFASAHEVEEKLLDNEMRVFAGGGKGWTTAGTWPLEPVGPNNLLEVYDDAKRRFLFVIDNAGNVDARVYSGVEARRPKETLDPTYWPKPQTERFHKSPNGKFILRSREWANSHDPRYYPISGRMTLLARVPNDKGRPVDVEMWTRTYYGEMAAIKVSDSGNTVAFNFGWTKYFPQGSSEGSMQRQAHALVLTPDGEANMYTVEQWGFAKPDDARQGISLDKVKFSPLGQDVANVVDGVELRGYQCEKLDIPLKGGKSKTFFVFMHPIAYGGRVQEDQPRVRQYIGIDKQ